MGISQYKVNIPLELIKTFYLKGGYFDSNGISYGYRARLSYNVFLVFKLKVQSKRKLYRALLSYFSRKQIIEIIDLVYEMARKNGNDLQGATEKEMVTKYYNLDRIKKIF